MTVTYRVRDGETDIDGEFEGRGYSGYGNARNDSSMEHRKSYGPIPRGKYSIGHCFDHETLGPYVFRLTPVGHDAFGRTGFCIHGDNQDHTASHGCIILARAVRLRIRDTGQELLEVV
jgi:hypothetical protein